MRTASLIPSTLLLALLGVATAAQAADAPAPAEQVIVPQVDRREVRMPRFPSNDFEAGVFGGVFSTQNFGSSGSAGLRFGYHITEDFFAEASLGQTKVSDRLFRQVLPGGIFPTGSETLRYRELSIGMNVLPGEVFFGTGNAKASAGYIIGGLGTVSFNGQRLQAANFGAGLRVYLRDWVNVRIDVRDHVFALDLLGKRTLTQNPEMTAGLSFLF